VGFLVLWAYVLVRFFSLSIRVSSDCVFRDVHGFMLVLVNVLVVYIPIYVLTLDMFRQYN
jgi:hypothetical protein